MVRRGLGRGLAALIPGALAEVSGPASDLEVSLLSTNPFQPRREMGGPEFEELVASIRRHGVLQPIIVRPSGEGYEIVAGERRWRAAREAGLVRIPAVVREIGDKEMLEVALIENLRREDLNPIERGQAYRRLVQEFHLTQEQVADVVGGSRPAIANAIRLLDLPGEVQAAIVRGRLSEGHGRALLTIQDPRALLGIWRVVEERKLSVRETEELVRARGRRVSRETPPRRRGTDPQIRDLAAQLRERYSTSVAIVPRGHKGVIQIGYYSQDDLGRLIDLLLR
jgi:ParB family transcriptional regulator, chromosome partitioning protein